MIFHGSAKMCQRRFGLHACHQATLVMAAALVLGVCSCAVADPARGSVITLGFPENIEGIFGKLTFGVEPPCVRGDVTGLSFRICGVLPRDEGAVVYGLDKKQQVWRACTRDGFRFTEESLLFQLPAASTRWLVGGMALKDGKPVLLQCQEGRRPMSEGHSFHVFSGSLDGHGWQKLNDEPVYCGQDAFNIVWNGKLKRFVNYQTSYQPWTKRYADNLPSVRRVLHIRTSPDGLSWTPSESFAANGPYLPDTQLIVPDSEDSPDTEFYHFSAVDFGEFWMGIMVTYVSQPPQLPRTPPFPHGPFLDCEWWISRDGMNWDRPFRENSALEETRFPFAYQLCQPIICGDDLRWPIGGQVYELNRRRMCYAYCRANAEVVTRAFELSGRPLTLDLSFESVRRKAERPLHQGYLMAELLDKDGQVIKGFERDKCVFMPGEQTRLTLKWGRQQVPASGTGHVVRLRLLFRDVRLYSVSD